MKLPSHSILTVAVTTLAGAGMVGEAQAHGSMQYPKSRVLRTYEVINQQNPPVWAEAAFAVSGRSA